MFDPSYKHSDPGTGQYSTDKVEQDRISVASSAKHKHSAVDKAKAKLQNAGKAIGKLVKGKGDGKKKD
jgi:hypothetical protein